VWGLYDLKSGKGVYMGRWCTYWVTVHILWKGEKRGKWHGLWAKSAVLGVCGIGVRCVMDPQCLWRLKV
jgi:hypothetical protein